MFSKCVDVIANNATSDIISAFLHEARTSKKVTLFQRSYMKHALRKKKIKLFEQALAADA
ncbi:hypothetical protein CCR75_005471 [Bremia lactucae]|uniref:Uncharacterized protein n=1 Tax=Bremia lactucae TaxID=4779 RepID=A0A976IDK1_BRELC|nr:hypothetical protein CCR75_005471 [Bremia lactucae]